jgi:hypothetical protein
MLVTVILALTHAQILIIALIMAVQHLVDQIALLAIAGLVFALVLNTMYPVTVMALDLSLHFVWIRMTASATLVKMVERALILD